MTTVDPIALTLTPFEPAGFSSSVSFIPFILDSEASLTVDVGLQSGSNSARGIVSPNIYHNGLASFHKHYGAESANQGDLATVYGSAWATGITPALELDYIGLAGEARSDCSGSETTVATAVGLRGEGLCGGGAQKNRVWAILAEGRLVADGTFTSVSLSRGNTTVTVPGGQTTTALAALLTAGATVYVGDSNADSIPDNTTVVSVTDAQHFVISNAPIIDSTLQTITYCQSNSSVIGAELAVFNYGPVDDSLLLPAQSHWHKVCLRLGSRGSFPVTAFITNVNNKAGGLHGVWFQQCCTDFARFETPARPGCVGMFLGINTAVSQATVETTSGSTTMTRTSGAAFSGNALPGQKVSGPGIKGNTYIASISSDYTSITLTRAAAKTQTGGSAATLRFSNWGAAARIPRDAMIQGVESDGTTLHDLIGLDGDTNYVRLGDPGADVMLPNGTNIRARSADASTTYVLTRLSTGNSVVVGDANVALALNATAISIPNNAAIVGINNAGNGNVTLMKVTTGDVVSLGDASNAMIIQTDTTTGVKIGTATGQKVAFHNSTPVAQRAGAAQVAVATTASTQTTPYGYTTQAQADAIVTLVNEIRAALVEKGLIKGAA